MDSPSSNALILRQVLRAETQKQPRSRRDIRLWHLCDDEAGHYALLCTGWEQEKPVDFIVFFARVVGQQVVIEKNNTDYLLDDLLDAGLPAADIVTAADLKQQQVASPVAA